jgi:hypothetical protein
MKLLLALVIDSECGTGPAPRLAAACAAPEYPASRADAEFYCLFSINARQSGTHSKKEPRRDSLSGCIDEASLRRT